MKELYVSEDKAFRLYEMEGDLYVAQMVPNYPNDTVLIADGDIFATALAMLKYHWRKKEGTPF